ncbi:hypothetical protein Tco_1035592, partial [Tanacetum coccineum]
MPRKSKSGYETTFAKDAKRGTKPQWKISKPDQVLIKVSGKVPTLLQDPKILHEKERLPMDHGSRKGILRDE